MIPKTVQWVQTEDGPAVRMIEQTLLPNQEEVIDCKSVDEVCDAIRRLAVRGAPAIGCAAALGMALAVARSDADDIEQLRRQLQTARDDLAATRPTAVNLFWALKRMEQVIESTDDIEKLKKALIAEANDIVEDDLQRCRQIGRNGAQLIPAGADILTHCNAGALATAGYGTALGVIRAAHEKHGDIHVWADETRPLLQGARLTSWELLRDHIPCTVICDDAAGSIMARDMVDCCVVGADRIAANGDTANKIGTYILAVLSDYHDIPFYVAAPVSTIDYDIEAGDDIPIEQREPEEVSHLAGLAQKPATPPDANIHNPAFDVTPAELIAAIITERGVARPPYTEALAVWRE